VIIFISDIACMNPMNKVIHFFKSCKVRVWCSWYSFILCNL